MGPEVMNSVDDVYIWDRFSHELALQWPDILALVLYFVLVLGIGIGASLLANTSDSQGYFLAGQNSNWFLIGTSTFATNIGAPMFVGLAGSAAASGIAVVMFEWHAMFMLVALGWLFLPVYRACGCFTMPQYLKRRFGGQRISLIMAIIHTLNTLIASISGQMYAGALFIQQIFRWNLYLSVCVILAITAIYTVVGGLTAVLWTDAIQTIILIVGASALAFITLDDIGGFESMRNQFADAMADYTRLDQSLYGNRSCGVTPDNAWHIFRPVDDGSYPWPGLIFGLTILATNAWCTDQVCVQRSLSAKNVSHAKAGVLLAAYLKTLSFLFFIIPGMISRVLYQNEVGCADPDLCRAICDNPGGCTNIAYPLLVIRNMPDGLRGLMLAAMLAALMSSLTSVFNSSSTIFTLDIWKKVVRKKANEQELMVVGRVYTLLLVGTSIAWLPILQAVQGSQFWDYVQEIYSHILPPIVSAFIMGIFWKRMTEQGAFWSIVICMVIGLIRLFMSWIRSAPACGSSDPDNTWSWISDVHYLHFAIILYAVAFFLQVLISWITEPRPASKLRRVTFWTRNDPEMMELSDDEFGDVEGEEETKTREAKEQLEGEADEEEVEKKKSLFERIKARLCGMESVTKRKMTKQEFLHMQQELSDINEEPRMRRIMDANAVICVAAAIFLHAFWA